MRDLDRERGFKDFVRHVTAWRTDRFAGVPKTLAQRAMAALCGIGESTYRTMEDSKVFTSGLDVAIRLALLTEYDWRLLIEEYEAPDYRDPKVVSGLLASELTPRDLERVRATLGLQSGRARKSQGGSSA